MTIRGCSEKGPGPEECITVLYHSPFNAEEFIVLTPCENTVHLYTNMIKLQTSPAKMIQPVIFTMKYVLKMASFL